MKSGSASIVFALLFALARPAAAAAAGTVTVTPAEDEAAVLHNPNMGWVLYENFPLDPNPQGSSTLLTLPGERFDGVDEVALMFSWYDVERTPDVYDFSRVDQAYDYWRKFGKRIQLRMSAETLLWWDNANPPAGKGVPDYVVARLSEAEVQTRGTKDIPPYRVVDARNPYYLQRLEKFLAAVAKHYRGEREVTLVDLRGFGLWGEWHQGFKYPSLPERHKALSGVIDRWSAAFPHNWVALSCSYDPDMPPELWSGPTNTFDAKFTTHYDEFVRFSAFDHALTKPNVTWRRDGCGGAVHSNERKFLDAAFKALSKGPFMSEFMDGYASSKKGKPGWIEWKVEDALSLHPNYINLLGYQCADALAFLHERKDLVEHGLRTMGYRLVPTKLTYPSEIVSGAKFEITGQWVNRAVGRAMRDFTLRLTLVNAEGKVIATTDAGPLEASKWVKGKSYAVQNTATFTDVAAAGTYNLCLALVDPKGGAAISLPLKGAAAQGGYRVGTVKVSVNK
jgi:hypothetical protein